MDTKFNQSNLDAPGAVADLQIQLEREDKKLAQVDKNLSLLKNKAPEIVPIKQRRTKVKQPVNINAICDWDSADIEISKGDVFTLMDNSKPDSWVVQNAKGETKNAPAACFVIPPPDQEAIDKAKSLEAELSEAQKKKAVVQNKLKSSRTKEPIKTVQLGKLSTNTWIVLRI
ncbi:hypothetical protein GDO86_013718 [Hymenochirus boettgeri]|uniref:SH3 domain-containing protein n=1 Tax=Hymenochirus boettgeri TaxID=247094 RepID=A0A8T2JTX5_9PIPI|nr:hypothetical protein GDO86_013718 [Hymenochirus boettgeri]